MKKKITDDKIIKQYVAEVRALGEKYNIYPMANFNLVGNELRYNYYELDKMTPEEMRGYCKYEENH